LPGRMLRLALPASPVFGYAVNRACCVGAIRAGGWESLSFGELPILSRRYPLSDPAGR
jgi:hypothetical protein